MQIFRDIAGLKTFLNTWRKEGKSIGFVPTMGALHNGHLSLIEASKSKCDLTVCSIFINPTQFNDSKDFEKYPRTVDNDLILLQKYNCDVVFCPTDDIMYPEKTQLQIHFGYLEHIMEGKHRPGHFSGVGLIVAKLFHVVQPDLAFFGQKDLQQFMILDRLTKDLLFDIELVCCPIIREEDGLAMSSRNQRLSKIERLEAVALFQALQLAKEHLLNGKNITETKKIIYNFFEEKKSIHLEYFEIVDRNSLQSIEESIQKNQQLALCIAAYIGEIRLIDNIIINY
ncbi:pantoate--beta-alanine ligase [Xanthovirga aplysinae]|uniref:pantoate--beta-alanine ligase n=1 Tax=Xanthovirga aplysinae TaxID=2529853 RepID=UPI0012BC5261|nr:pantoate--beta-alanine ligase [Xanthovirga aplysinae]MTI31532.1 pantoate--beta-alanine ligase [Xanthovirga aplysinae]